MGPVFEHALVDALGLTQIRAPVGGDPAPQDMVMRAFDDIDGVDLDIAQMFHRGRCRLRPLAERHLAVEPLGTQPDAPGLGFGQGMNVGGPGHNGGI